MSRVRVAAVVRAPLQSVNDVVAALPASTTGYVVETGAGVLVTLERRLRWPFTPRRRVIRVLQRELANLTERYRR